jgi:hypothetical protein
LFASLVSDEPKTPNPWLSWADLNEHFNNAVGYLHH